MPALTLIAFVVLFVMTVIAILAWGGAKSRSTNELVLRRLWQDRAADRLTIMLAERELLVDIVEDGKAAPHLLDAARDLLYGDIDQLLGRDL